MKRTTFLIAMLVTLLLVGCQSKHLNVVSLKIEMQENPQGIATLNPRFSWQITSEIPDVVQQSYRIQVAQTKEDLAKEQNLLWDSGDVNSDQSILIPYEGSELASRGIYYWRVKVNTNQSAGKWSKPQFWTMALLNDTEWQAQWIGEDSLSNPNETAEGNTRLAARYLRKSFSTKDSKIKRAALYISGLGMYEAFLNGKRISEDVLLHSFVVSRTGIL